MVSETVGLSKRERGLLGQWERARTKSVRLEEIARAVGVARLGWWPRRWCARACSTAFGPGCTRFRPFRAMARPWTLPSLVAVELLLAGEPHYVGGLAAFTLNRLTQQQHTSIVDVFVTSFRRPRRLGEAEIVFHRRKVEVFQSGLTRIEVDGTAVAVSDPERTVLDALEEFHVVGGMAEAIRLFHGRCRALILLVWQLTR